MYSIEKPVKADNGSGHCRGIVLIVPGLNQSVDSLAEIRAYLQQQDFVTCQVQLAGFAAGDPDLHRCGRELWLGDLDEAYRAAELQHPELPRYFLGYSLGAALGVCFVARNAGASFSAMCHISPAFALCRKAAAMRLLLPLARRRVALPSLAPAEFRANSRTSLRAYRGCFAVVDEIAALPDSGRIAATPARIAMSKRDSLVSWKGIADWLRRNGITQWPMVEISPRPERYALAFSPISQHTLLGPESLGSYGWQQLCAVISSTFATDLGGARPSA